jgi:hypothetical protein
LSNLNIYIIHRADRRENIKSVKVWATLRLTVYRKSPPLVAKPFAAHEQRFLGGHWNPCGYNPCATSSLTREH